MSDIYSALGDACTALLLLTLIVIPEALRNAYWLAFIPAGFYTARQLTLGNPDKAAGIALVISVGVALAYWSDRAPKTEVAR
jgi:hypothetical protein